MARDKPWPVKKVGIAFALVASLLSCEATPRPAAPPPETRAPAPAGGFALVGHTPLLERGMNAGLALHGQYAYIGSRTDGTHANAGVLIVDIGDPDTPRVLGQIGPPNEAGVGSSSRELRAWTAQNVLIVLNIPCEPALHLCASRSPAATVHFYDIGGSKGLYPELVATYRPSETPHEMFLWTDPARKGRALLYLSTNLSGAKRTSMIVADVSEARRGRVREVLAWSGGTASRALADAKLHSLSVSKDGRQAVLAYQRAGVIPLDTTDLARGLASPRVRLHGPVVQSWPWPGAHSAVVATGNVVVVTEEVYGGRSSCPWGVMRFVDVGDPARPKITSKLALAENDEDYCAKAPRGSYTYSTHNPTPVGANIVLVSWHAGGLRAALTRDPARPAHLASFVPKPIEHVAVEDPALTTGAVKVAMWSYPIVHKGLVYVVDVRNGLYVLRLEALSDVAFADGGSTAP